MNGLSLHFSDKLIPYTGEELASHWIFQNLGISGNALVSFIGPAHVPLDHMVDLEDVKRKAPIASPSMVHFLGEWFIDSLNEGILLQHLLLCEIYETLWESGIRDLYRRGNDIYYQNRKLSVSIATKSPVSVLVHAAVNVETDGTPIPTSGLKEMGLSPPEFSKKILERFSEDYQIWSAARCKVRAR